MTDEQKNSCGCIILVVILLWVGIAWRTQDVVQFLVMGLFAAGGLFLLLLGLALLVGETKSDWGWLWLAIGVLLLISLGSFLLTGDFDRSVKIAMLNWSTPTPVATTIPTVAPTTILASAPTAVAFAQSTATPSATWTPARTSVAIAQATSSPTAILTRTPQPTLVPAPVPAAAQSSYASNADPSVQQLTKSLNEIWQMSPENAAKEAKRLGAISGSSDGDRQRDSALLAAVALERAGDHESALAAYTQCVNQAKRTPHAVTAGFRLRLIGNATRGISEREAIYAGIAKEPVSEGWFLVSDRWTWATTQQGALQILMDLRADQLSIRFLQYVRSYSPFPMSYSYLFILLVVTLAVKVLELPLYVRVGIGSAKLQQLQPEIDTIKTIYSNDSAAMNQALWKIYQQLGSNLWGGCLASIVDLIFVIWALVALGSFSPQLILDGAQLATIPDVTKTNLEIMVGWLALTFVQMWINSRGQQTVSTVTCGVLVYGVVVIGLAWFLQWPAYVFIFWMLLTLVGMLISGMLRVGVTVSEWMRVRNVKPNSEPLTRGNSRIPESTGDSKPTRALGNDPLLSSKVVGTELCPNCHAINRTGAKLCRLCGTSLTSADPSQLAKPDSVPGANHAETARPQTGMPSQTAVPSTLPALPVGTLANRRYRVQQTIDTQPHSNTYFVIDIRSQQPCILQEAAQANLYQRERSIVEKALNHPALVLVKDVFAETPPGNALPRGYLVTEFPLSPFSLPGTPAEGDILSWGIQLADAVEYLHENQVAHNNIRAENLRVSNGQIKLGNFLTITPVTDVARAKDTFDLAMMIMLYLFATPAGQAAAPLSPASRQVMERATAPDPSQRYPSAREFGHDLNRALRAIHLPAITKPIVGSITDIGMKRELNEDSLLTMDVSALIHTVNHNIGLFVVADGMGGANAGEVASRMVTQVMAREMIIRMQTPRVATSAPGDSDYGAELRAAVSQVNTAVFQARQASKNDMGSTIVAALLVDNVAYVVNVGDGRCYLVAPDRMEKITKDHSLVQALLDRGQIEEKDVRTHPQRNFILRCIGDKQNVQSDLYTVLVEPGQTLLLCSDGLWEMVLDDVMQRIIATAPSPQDACRELVNAANAPRPNGSTGGDDNITCILVHVEAAGVA